MYLPRIEQAVRYLLTYHPRDWLSSRWRLLQGFRGGMRGILDILASRDGETINTIPSVVPTPLSRFLRRLYSNGERETTKAVAAARVDAEGNS